MKMKNIITWEDIYKYIKKNNIVSINNIKNHFHLKNNNHLRKIDGLVSHNMIQKNNGFVRII